MTFYASEIALNIYQFSDIVTNSSANLLILCRILSYESLELFVCANNRDSTDLNQRAIIPPEFSLSHKETTRIGMVLRESEIKRNKQSVQLKCHCVESELRHNKAKCRITCVRRKARDVGLSTYEIITFLPFC